jgi:hypothetical protein
VSGEQVRIADPNALDQVTAILSASLHLDGAEAFRRRHKVMEAPNLLRRRKLVVFRGGGCRSRSIRTPLASLQQPFEELDAGIGYPQVGHSAA